MLKINFNFNPVNQCAICRLSSANQVCLKCIARFAHEITRCPTCALEVLPHLSQQSCFRCLQNPPIWNSCHAGLTYGFPWAQCITQFKFSNQPSWAKPLARILFERSWVKKLLSKVDLILPMPLSKKRLQERGYNQAIELARYFIPLQKRHLVHLHYLLRLRDTKAQSGLNRADRLINLQHAFALEPLYIHHIKNRRILLLDDVMTTGASLHFCADLLQKAGALEIHTVVLARTPTP